MTDAMFTTEELIIVRDSPSAHPVTKRLAGLVIEMQDAAAMTSWPPAGKMDFGNAIRALKQGKRVARAGWNGKGMWLVLVQFNQYLVVPGHIGASAEPLPWIGMKTADDKFVPWLASQTDVLVEDWEIVQ